jgi:hypothetical protein
MPVKDVLMSASIHGSRGPGTVPVRRKFSGVEQAHVSVCFLIHFTLLIHFHYLYDAAGDLVAQNPPCVYIPHLSLEKPPSLDQDDETKIESTVLPARVLPVLTVN